MINTEKSVCEKPYLHDNKSCFFIILGIPMFVGYLIISNKNSGRLERILKEAESLIKWVMRRQIYHTLKKIKKYYALTVSNINKISVKSTK